jgi:hypothetical protein
MLLSRSNSLLALSIAVLVAGVAGVQLGQSAIGAINPLYFEGAAPPPRAVDGRERQPAEPAYYQAYDWQQGAETRAIACGDNCGAPEPYDPYLYAEAPQPRLAGAAWRDPTTTAEPAPWPRGQVSSEPRAAMMRYADYPIEAKPEAAETDDEPPADYQQADVYEE